MEIVFKTQPWPTNPKNVEKTCNFASIIASHAMIVGAKKMRVCATSLNSAKLNVVMIGVTHSARVAVMDWKLVRILEDHLVMKNAWSSVMIVVLAGGWRILVAPNAAEEQMKHTVIAHAAHSVKGGMSVTRFVFRNARIVKNVGVI